MPHVQPARVEAINDQPVRQNGRYVLYWMQQSQRARFNHALEHAIEQANQLDLPVVVVFGLMDDYPEANRRHYRFMLQGLACAARDLHRRRIALHVRHGNPVDVILQAAREAAMLVCDCGYLRHQRQWRAQVAQAAPVQAVQVEADVVVPLDLVSSRQEHAARTIRPKIHRKLADYLIDLPALPVRRPSLDLSVKLPGHPAIDVTDPDAALGRLQLSDVAAPVDWIVGGTDQAIRRLDQFIDQQLGQYVQQRNQPHLPGVSIMSPYLHFGQVSPVEVALKIQQAHRGGKVSDEQVQAYLEQLIVRRELACNFVQYCEQYDRYEGLPAWARTTLNTHQPDPRPHRYTPAQFEQARTHEPYWNAAMRDMQQTGYLHNHMRMYWGKMILNWSDTPQQAYQTALTLNNRYFLDGRDPVSFASIAWLFGQHDRPWPQRPVFGTVRSMAVSGLKRKTDPEAYLLAVAQRTGR